ncbi:MAG: hypothetical protein IJA23_06215 [Clostridia bacterium]|nr:hypothetical protein [Clostridia bacterium]
MKLKCGIFLDRRIVEGDDWDMQPIGAHAYIRRKQRENAETAGLEYYHIEDGRTYIVENPTLAEKALAQATRTTGKKVVGYRNAACHVADTKELKQKLEEMRAYAERQMQ